ARGRGRGRARGQANPDQGCQRQGRGIRGRRTRIRSSRGRARGEAEAWAPDEVGERERVMSQAIATTGTEQKRGQRKVRLGTVIADKMDKTVIVQVGTSQAHRLYRKTVQQRSRCKVHDEKNECGVGDLVRIIETRPISKEKRWRVLEIVEKAK